MQMVKSHEELRDACGRCEGVLAGEGRSEETPKLPENLVLHYPHIARSVRRSNTTDKAILEDAILTDSGERSAHSLLRSARCMSVVGLNEEFLTTAYINGQPYIRVPNIGCTYHVVERREMPSKST